MSPEERALKLFQKIADADSGIEAATQIAVEIQAAITEALAERDRELALLREWAYIASFPWLVEGPDAIRMREIVTALGYDPQEDPAAPASERGEDGR